MCETSAFGRKNRKPSSPTNKQKYKENPSTSGRIEGRPQALHRPKGGTFLR